MLHLVGADKPWSYIIINAAVLIFFLGLLGYWLSYDNEEAPNFNGSSNVDICIFSHKAQPGYIVSALKIYSRSPGYQDSYAVVSIVLHLKIATIIMQISMYSFPPTIHIHCLPRRGHQEITSCFHLKGPLSLGFELSSSDPDVPPHGAKTYEVKVMLSASVTTKS